MKKKKLQAIRKQKGITQQQIADILPTEVSNYSRKENGITKIIQKEWIKIANFLNVPVEEIYEDDHKEINDSGIDDENIYRYLSHLEKENAKLRNKLEMLKIIISG
ncbi:helix-turn-helix transcriptional regulator [Chryseobacterium sp. WG23]|uniref:helix-turn-helix domain-containing protein n=1 Tax=Chryseobacterium sp. WG23 TaxID=2926910 RepID=UPI00211EE9FA|nr:helix-turn-helix transcriptional regulator [Chryseobacterium sp. WG23]MCQ9633908.1 helix-turn-helix transcriptional regulator [Chryseobacterium sp. WG23]